MFLVGGEEVLTSPLVRQAANTLSPTSLADNSSLYTSERDLLSVPVVVVVVGVMGRGRSGVGAYGPTIAAVVLCVN